MGDKKGSSISWVAKLKEHKNAERKLAQNRAFLKGGDLNPGERHSRDTRDDGTMTLCTLRATTALCHAIVAQILVVP